MILYYALGGGLGHLARTHAILEKISNPQKRFRVLASSTHIELVRKKYPCPIDQVTGFTSLITFRAFLQDYLKKNSVRHIIFDTFPAGLLGEWAGLREDIPRLLIARNLKWSVYRRQLKNISFKWPWSTLLIEPAYKTYMRIITGHSQVDTLNQAIINGLEKKKAGVQDNKQIAIIHTGSRQEQDRLLEIAQITAKKNNLDPTAIGHIYPGIGLYPFTPYAGRYKIIISGCGYNSMALSLANVNTRFIFVPFKRKYDNQHYRNGCYNNMKWLNGTGGAGLAAEWIEKKIKAT